MSKASAYPTLVGGLDSVFHTEAKLCLGRCQSAGRLDSFAAAGAAFSAIVASVAGVEAFLAEHVAVTLRAGDMREEDLEGSNIRFEYYGLEPGYQEEEAKRMEIAAVPTGVIYVDGKEVGRAAGQSWRFPSLKILRAVGPATLHSQ